MTNGRLRSITRQIDPFLVLLILVFIAASLIPVRGRAVPVADIIADGAIILLFFLHGAKLSREAILDGISSWRVHSLVLAATFLLFPVLGLITSAALPLDPVMLTGVLFLTLLPSTVQSSIAFTAIAGGNVAAAICSASLSNIAGLALTPMLTSLFIGNAAGGTTQSIQTIVLQLLLPFIAGHLCRPFMAPLLSKYRSVVPYVDRGSVLIVVYNAFSAAVVGGLWHRLHPWDLFWLVLASVVILAVMMVSTVLIGKAWNLPWEDRIVVLFCGSKKSLVTGVPMAGALFPPAIAGPVILPLMIFHQLQLMVCAVLAQQLRTRTEEGVTT